MAWNTKAMRITFKHILFLISLLAFLGAMKAYAGIEEDLKKQLQELEVLNKPVRAPAKLDPPTPLPEDPEKELVEKTSPAEITKEEAEALKKIPAPKITLANNIEEIQNTIHFISGQVFADEGQVKREEKERTVATEEKRYNFANNKDGIRALPKIIREEKRQHEMKNGWRVGEPREVVQDGTRVIIPSEKPLFTTLALHTPQIRPQHVIPAPQNNAELEEKLNFYKEVLTNPQTPPQQFEDILKRYQDLLIQPKTSSPSQESQEQITSREEIWKPEPIVLDNLKQTLQELQDQNLQDRVKRVLDDVVVTKLDASAKTYDTKSYKDTLKTFRVVHDYEDPTDPTKNVSVPKYYYSEFTKRDTKLKDKVQEVEKLLDESILNALNEDFSGNLSKAVAELNRVVEILKTQVITLAEMRKLSPEELVGRALDKKDKTPEERFAAIQMLSALMQDSTTGIRLRDEERQAILDFLNNEFPAYLAQKKEECEKAGQTTILADENKLKGLHTAMGNIRNQLSDISMPSSTGRSLASQRLETVKRFFTQFEPKFDAFLEELASRELHRELTKEEKEQKRLCEQGKANCKIGKDYVIQAQKSVDAASAAPEDMKASFNAKNALKE